METPPKKLPEQEVRTVAHGRASRTPFTLLLMVAGVVAVVVAVVMVAAAAGGWLS